MTTPTDMPRLRIAVLIPCHNEAVAIGAVVAGFRAHLPDAKIHVYDNNSTDNTAQLARAAGAVVRAEKLQGKGHVVRRMFADIEADCYVLVDGDNTYDAAASPAMLGLLRDDGLDMVTALRIAAPDATWRPFHRLGNAVLTGLVAQVFAAPVQDLLSGYRVFSRRFVKSFPALATGFETETELTVHALELRMPIAELPTTYRPRPPGSASKLSTWRDGFRILRSIVQLVKEERPLQFFAILALLLAASGLALGIPVIVTFLHIGQVPRLPTAVLATGLMLLASLALACGLILDSVTRGRREAKRMAYLAIPGIAARCE